MEPLSPPRGPLIHRTTSATPSASSHHPTDNNDNNNNVKTNNTNNEVNEADLYGACRPVKSYQKLNQIGEGAYGTVYRGIDKATGEMVALKRVILHNEKQDGFPLTSLREIRMLKLIGRHPNCVRLEEIAVGRKRDGVFLVFEYCEVSKFNCEDIDDLYRGIFSFRCCDRPPCPATPLISTRPQTLSCTNTPTLFLSLLSFFHLAL